MHIVNFVSGLAANSDANICTDWKMLICYVILSTNLHWNLKQSSKKTFILYQTYQRLKHWQNKKDQTFVGTLQKYLFLEHPNIHLALPNLSRFYLISKIDFGKILTWYFQNFFDCRGNHMRSESVNWWFHFDGSGILSTRHTTRLFTLVNEACIELMVPFTFRRSVTGAAPLGL